MIKNKIIFLTSLFLVGFIFTLHIIPSTEAAPQAKPPKIINVILSESCQKQLQERIKTTCAWIGELIPFDTTNQNISGHFIKPSLTSDYSREKPQSKYHLKFYTKDVVCVLCDINYFRTSGYQTIIVTHGDFSFVDKFVNNKTKTVNVYNSRYMEGCNTATITFSKELLNDTIKYLESDCKKTSFNNTSVKKLPDSTPSKYNSPFTSYNFKNYVSSLKNLGNCIINHCNIKPIYRNWN